MKSKEIKCPRCGETGKTYEYEGRWYFHCFTCLMTKLLKELNAK